MRQAVLRGGLSAFWGQMRRGRAVACAQQPGLASGLLLDSYAPPGRRESETAV